jgi:hypothetical protein
MKTIVCSHPRLRALDYDEDTFHWVVSCKDCGHTGTMTQAEWRKTQRSRVGTPSSASLRAFDDKSGRVAIR